uniref:Uncharacterized protein n=1 Tax=Nelumbo nucifera TaxID=4432 RepID=A0A822Z0W2_NELNU|nr:TPA_asm: hypothetical protein HUJ06_009011 [Nelumbo nucifera]
MYEFLRDSEGEIGSAETLNSSQSSMSSDSCGNISRLSFDALEISAKTSSYYSPGSFAFKPHRSSDFAWEAIRSAISRRKSGLTFRISSSFVELRAATLGASTCAVSGPPVSAMIAVITP